MPMAGFSELNGVYQDLAVVGAELLLLILVAGLVLGAAKLVFGMLQRSSSARLATLAQTLWRKLRGTLILLALLLALALLAYNGYQMYHQNPLLTHTQELWQHIPPGFWPALAIGAGKTCALLLLAPWAIRILHRLLMNTMERFKAWRQFRANDEAIEAFFLGLDRIQRTAIWLLVLAFAALALQLPATVPVFLLMALRIFLIIALGLLVVRANNAIIESLDALSKRYAHQDIYLEIYEKLRGLIPLLRRALEYIIYVFVATLVLLQVNFIAQLAEYGPRLVQVIGIVFLSRVVVELGKLLIDRSMGKTDDLSPVELQQRMTLVPLIKSLLSYAIYFAAFVLIMQAFGIDPTPVLAGAGILGIVIGLGAQPLINDLVSGFFILFENLYLVGDYVEIGTSKGTVEMIDVRTTRIRNPNGELHILRNGQIGEIVNFSKTYIFAVVEVGVIYESDLDQVYRVLQETGESLKAKNPDVLEATRVQGLKEFGESELLIRTVTKVKPGCHMQVARELRKLIKEAFDREGIQIPSPRRVVLYDPAEQAPM
jgi:small conductance mechanosensitive channel